MTKDEALKLALEALEWNLPVIEDHGVPNQLKMQHKAITSIYEALAQPEQKKCENCGEFGECCQAQSEQTNTRPYYTIDELNVWADEKEKQAWRNAAIRVGEELSSAGPDGYYDMNAWQWLDWAMEQQPRGKNYLAQPEQERNFCPRCGKRLGKNDWDVHTCTPPLGKE